MREPQTAQRRRPRIPSYLLHNLNQQPPRPLPPQRGRAYKPAKYLVNTPRRACNSKATDQHNRHILRCLEDRPPKIAHAVRSGLGRAAPTASSPRATPLSTGDQQARSAATNIANPETAGTPEREWAPARCRPRLGNSAGPFRPVRYAARSLAGGPGSDPG